MKNKFSQQNFEIVYMSNFMKVLTVGTELLHAEERAEGRKDIKTD